MADPLVPSDPIGLSGGLNTYGYVGGNPQIYADPFGLLGVYVVAEVDLNFISGFSLSGGGYASTSGSGEINGIAPTIGVEFGIDIEIGLFTGTQPPKNDNAVELDIDGGPVGVTIGDTGDGGYVGFSFGPGTPGIVFNPGQGLSLPTIKPTNQITKPCL